MSNENAQTSGEPKMVPESDLIAAKKGLEKQLEEVQSASSKTITDLRTEKDKNYQDLLIERTAKEQLESKVKELEPFKTQAADLLNLFNTGVTNYNSLEEKMLTLRKDLITTKYGVGSDKLEGKKLADLDNLEDALKVAGVAAGGGRNYDMGGGTGGSAAGTPFANELGEIKEAKAARGIKD